MKLQNISLNGQLSATQRDLDSQKQQQQQLADKDPDLVRLLHEHLHRRDLAEVIVNHMVIESVTYTQELGLGGDATRPDLNRKGGLS